MAGSVQVGRLWEKGVRYITLRSTVQTKNSVRTSITNTFNLGILVEIACIPDYEHTASRISRYWISCCTGRFRDLTDTILALGVVRACPLLFQLRMMASPALEVAAVKCLIVFRRTNNEIACRNPRMEALLEQPLSGGSRARYRPSPVDFSLSSWQTRYSILQ
jgi:hypothetical protein